LTINGATADLSGNQYEADFLNSAGTLVSNPATLAVDSITSQPNSALVNAGGTVSFTAASFNSGDTVQWQVSVAGGPFTNLTDNSTYTGSLTGTLTINGATADLNGNQYEAVFTNVVGTLASNPATLTVDSITTQPVSQIVAPGGTVSFTAASSNPGDTVQWQVSVAGGPFANLTDNSTYTGSLTGTLTISGATAALSGNQYEADFTNSSGTPLVSNPATLTVDSITTPPGSQLVNAGGTATFKAASFNSGDTVQWQVSVAGGPFTNLTNNSVYSGTATGTLTITGATAALSGDQYEAVFKNAVGTLASNPATLTVDSVTTQPLSKLVNAGGTASFKAASSHSGDTVQWQVSTAGGPFTNVTDGGVYSRATTGTLTITGATAALSGNQYEADFTNGSGTPLASNAATLTVDSVTTQPLSKLVNAGGTASFKAASSHSGDTVQWQVSTAGGAFTNLTNNSVYSGATTGTLTISGATAALSGDQYEADFTNGSGTPLASNAATLTVDSVTTQPTSKLVNAGGTASFKAASSHSGDTVQWQVSVAGGAFTNVTDGGVYSGATTGTLTISGATAALNGNQYEADFTNGSGTPLASNAATLTVDSITTQPLSKTIDAGGTTTFKAASSHSGDTVQWQVMSAGGSTFTNVTNGGVYSGATTGTLTITGATAALGGNQYEADFINSAGTLASSAATLTVDYLPSVTTQPTAETVVAGGTATFTAVASGNPVPTVQWQVSTAGGAFTNLTNNSVYSGTTTGTLTITGATLAMSGNQYQAVFTNSVGSTTTSAVGLSVEAATTTTTGSLSGFVYLPDGAGFPGTGTYTVQLQSVDSQGNLSDVPGDGPAPIQSNGAYSFKGLTAGTYQIQISSSLTSLVVISSDEIQVTLAAGQSSTNNNFTILGPQPDEISLRMFLASDGSLSQYLTGLVEGGQAASALTADSITTQPLSQTVNAGGAATFTAASSNSADTVQWQVMSAGGSTFTNLADTGVYSGTATRTLTISGATAGLNGSQYEAVFTNASGTLTSNHATLTVDYAPSVTSSPSAQLVNAGGTTTFKAAASGNPTPAVQWQVSTAGGAFTNLSDNSVYNGTATGTLTITGATAALSGNQYQALFTNSVGKLASNPAALTVDSVTTQPGNETVDVGQGTSFKAVSSHAGDTVQWEVESAGGSEFTKLSDNSTYSGTTTGTLTISGATSALDGSQYEAVFTNASGNLASDPATLTVLYAPTTTTGPTDQLVNAGGMATFKATANGEPAPTVQWQVSAGGGAFANVSNGGVYSGATTGTLTISGATIALSGNQYEALFTNKVGKLASSPATLTVDSITGQSGSVTVNQGGTATFKAETSNPGDTVQWNVESAGGSTFTTLSDNSVYSGTATGTLTISGATGDLNGAQYEAVFTNSAGKLTSDPATLTVDYVTTQPFNQTVNAGQNASFLATSLNPSGNDTVQWEVSSNGGAFTKLSDNGVYSGTATGTLTITGATADMTGNLYEAVFTNTGTFASNPATLTVDTVPTVSQGPDSQSVKAGDTVTFQAAGSGNSAPTVQWEGSTDGGNTFTPIPGATSTTYSFTADGAENNEQYEAVFTNDAGTLASSPATLTVDYVTTQPVSLTVSEGDNATFKAASSNTGDTVQWQVMSAGGSTFTNLSNNSVYSGTATGTLTISGATADLDGSQYEAVFTTSAGPLASSPATLTVNYSPTLTKSPTDQTVVVGNTATFKAAASGDPAPSVQWQVMSAGSSQFTPLSDGGVYSGTATGTLTISGATANLNGNQYEAVFTNSIGSTPTAAASLSVEGYSISADQTVLGPSNDQAASFLISGGADGNSYIGFSYSCTITSSGTPTNSDQVTQVIKTGTMSASSQDVQNIDVSKLPNGTLTYSLQLTSTSNVAGPTVTATPAPTLYATPPAGYSMTVDQSSYNAVNVQSAGFTVVNAEVGATLNYVIAGHAGGSVISSVAVTSATQDVTGIDLSTCLGSTINFSITLTDPFKQTGSPYVVNVPLNTTVLSGYNISVSPTINASQAANTSFMLTGPNPVTTGTTYNYTVTSSGGPGLGPVTGSGNVNSTTQTINNIDVSGLPDGMLTYSVVLSNSAGAVEVQAQATLDTTPPSGFTVTPDESTINSVAIQSTGFTLAGTEGSGTYSYSISGSGRSPLTSSGSVTSATQDISGIDLSGFTGTVTFSVKLSDTAGNTSDPVNATATVDPTAPAAIALSTSVVVANAAGGTQAASGTEVGLLLTVGPEATSDYTYTLVAADDYKSFQIMGNELLTDAVLDSTGQYSIVVQSTDAQGESIEQPFTITVGATDPVTPTVSMSENTIAGGQANATVGTLSTTVASNGMLASQINYSLVPGTGSNDNNLFQIGTENGQPVLQTAAALGPGKYTVRVLSSGTFLASDIPEPQGVNGTYTFQVSLATDTLPSSFEQAAAAAGLITLSFNPSGTWYPAVAMNVAPHGSLAQTNYQGSYASFWSSVTTANPSATLQDLVGSSGVDLTGTPPNTWAVVDQVGQYAVGVQVFTEQTFTITVQ
jgi:hypothetical protein